MITIVYGSTGNGGVSFFLGNTITHIIEQILNNTSNDSMINRFYVVGN